MEDETKKEEVTIDETDWEKLYKEKDEQLAKVAAERENYKKVALSKKGKSNDDEDESEDERISRIVAEKLQTTNEAKLIQEKEEIARAAVKKVNELTVALRNRSQVGSSATSGGGQSTTEVKTDFWTPEQLAYFKKRGVDPEKTKENYLKLKNN